VYRFPAGLSTANCPERLTAGGACAGTPPPALPAGEQKNDRYFLHMDMNDQGESQAGTAAGGNGLRSARITPPELDRSGLGRAGKAARNLGKSWLMAVNTG